MVNTGGVCFEIPALSRPTEIWHTRISGNTDDPSIPRLYLSMGSNYTSGQLQAALADIRAGKSMKSSSKLHGVPGASYYARSS